MTSSSLFRAAAAALLSLAFVATLAAADDAARSGTPDALATTAGDALVTVAVKLDEEPVARYRGGVRGLAATSRAATGAVKLDPGSKAVRAYRAHLGARHAAFTRTARTAIPGLRVLHEYDMVIGGLAVQLPASALPALRAMPGVVRVYADTLEHPDTDQTPAFIGAKSAWGKLGGQTSAGEGVIVGVIDTGIWPEHPSFADPDPSGKPYTAPPGSRQCQFSGGANPGAPFTCNGKLIGAYRFMTAYDACGGCEKPVDDFSSARDGEGHGTHTATTAAGNGVVLADAFGIARGKVSGIAPRAHVIAYRVCGVDGCFGADTAAAVNQAVDDGVDVINFSISGGTDPYNDVTALAFLDAYENGVFVATSAGNDGPGANTVNHRQGWVTSTAASTDKKFYLSKLALKSEDGAKLKLVGASFTAGLKTPAPFILGAAVGDPTCDSTTADGAFTGMIVGCQRGGASGRVRKSFNVAQRGAIGLVLFNDPTAAGQQGLATDNHTIPSVHLDGPDAVKLIDFAFAHANLTASFTQGKLGGTKADVIASFSSRGGAGLGLGILKPDIAAPGVQILAGDTPQGFLAEHVDGQLFQAIQGTSMSSPHVAGAAALLRQAHPDWTPGAITSALMTTASTKKILKQDKVTPATPFDTGAGRVALKPALAAAATFDVTAQEYRDHEDDLWTVNHPSIFLPAAAPDSVAIVRTMQSHLAKDSVWKLSILGGAPGLAIGVPAKVTLPAGGTVAIPITLDRTGLPFDGVAHATLQLKGKGVLHLPISVVRAPLPNLQLPAAGASSPTTNGGSITISRTLFNAGTADAGPNFTSFYLSTDDAFSNDDVEFGFCTRATNLGPGLSSSCNGPIDFLPMPPLAPGVYHLFVLADSTNAVAESNENDNLFDGGTVTVE